MSPLPHVHSDGLPVPQYQELVSLSIGRETNIESILALEERIEKGDGDIIKLKRARNSLLNISTRVPPEVLARIFVWSLVEGYPFYIRWLKTGSYNFLLVCHHWFEVASRTPELWSFWGNTLRDWKKRHHLSGGAPLELLLIGSYITLDNSLDEPLQDALRDHAMRDAVRLVHIPGSRHNPLSAILSLLTPNGEGVRYSSVESISLKLEDDSTLDVSNFFALRRLPKLRYLHLGGSLEIPSWDHFMPQT